MVLGASLLIASPAFAYDVKSGDTMSKIARDNGVTLQELAEANPQIKDLNRIYVGQHINLVTNNRMTEATDYEKDLLARVVRAEAIGEPYAGKVAVAVVVLNRVDHKDFPNDIHSVIYQKGQFSPVANGEINKTADKESIRAVEEALTLDRSKGAGSLFFYNPSLATNRWLDSKPTTLVIGNHVFKK